MPEEVVAAYRKLSVGSSNLKLAANLGLGDSPDEVIAAFSPYLGVCLFSSPGADDRDYPVPFANSKGSDLFTIGNHILKIFDGDYKKIDELIDNKQLVKTKFVR